MYAGASAFLAGLFFAVRVAFADPINIGAPSFVSANSPASFVSGLYAYALSIAGALAVIMIVYGGVKYVASGGSVSARSDAMDIIKNAIFGIVLLFGGYIILYTINPNLVNIKNPNLPSAPPLKTLGFVSSTPPTSPGGSTGDCSISDSPSAADYHVVTFAGSNEETGTVYTWSFGDGSPSDTGQQVAHTFPANGVFTVSLNTSATNQTTGQVVTHSCTMQETIGTGGSGNCQIPSSGACSIAGLQSYGGYCFGGGINTAAGVCQVESSGNVTVASGVDKCDDGKPASYGLFQINLTANELTDASGNVLNCPSAFADGPYTGTHPHCKVINQSLYNQCVQAAQTGSINVAEACSLSKGGTDWSKWGPNTRQSCNVN